MAIAVLAGLAWMRTGQMHGSSVGRLANERAVAALTVQVTGDPRRSDRGPRPAVVVRAEVRQVQGRGDRWATAVPVVLTTDDRSPLASALVGSQWLVTARLSPPDAGADTAGYGQVLAVEPVAAPHRGWLLIERVRAGLRTAVADRPPGPRALVPALVVGDTTAMTPQQQDLFVVTGLTHLTAVSGANLTLLLGFVLVLARWAGVRGRWLTVTGLGTVAVFVALCRTEPSVLRATAMGLVALAGLGHGGDLDGSRSRGMRHLCVAVIALMAVDPWLGRSVGFALSALATAGILVWAPDWVARLAWAPRVVAEGIAVPLAAQLATQPVVSALSGQVSLVGLVANAVAGPLVAPATVAGFAAAGLSLVHPVPAAAAGWVAGWPAQGILWVAEFTGTLPGASVRVPAGPAVLMGIAVASLVLAWWTSRLLSRPWACAVVALLVSLVLVRPPAPPGWPPAGWDLVMCDVGQGDAAVVRVDRTSAVVVDTGPEPAGLARCLDQLGIRATPLVVLTHYHADHIGGLDGLLTGTRSVGLVLTTAVPIPAAAAHDVATALDAHGIARRTTVAGDRISVGEVRWETLWPTPAAVTALAGAAGPEPSAATGPGDADQESSVTNDDHESSVTNDTSVVGRLTTPAGMTVLFTGDLEPTGQAALLRTGMDLRATVLKVPHHGSGRQDPAFLAATGARWAVTSSAEGNSYHHPAPRTVRALEQLGMTVLRTDTSGAVALGVDHRRWVVRTQR